MAELHLPLDFERVPEYRMLCDAVQAPLATYLFLRLWVDLGYQAQLTNQPGFLPELAAKQLDRSVLVELGANAVQATKALEAAACLRAAPGGGFVCDRFAKEN